MAAAGADLMDRIKEDAHGYILDLKETAGGMA
jgi:hypothetical protein